MSPTLTAQEAARWAERAGLPLAEERHAVVAATADHIRAVVSTLRELDLAETAPGAPPAGWQRTVIAPAGGQRTVIAPAGGQRTVIAPAGGQRTVIAPAGGQRTVIAPAGGESADVAG